MPIQVRHIGWPKWDEIRFPKIFGQWLDAYLLDTDTDQFVLEIKYFILEDMEHSKL